MVRLLYFFRTGRLPNFQHPIPVEKMEEWMANGCKLAWLIDPFQRKVFIYKASQQMRIHEDFETSIEGEDVLPGFELPLNELDE